MSGPCPACGSATSADDHTCPQCGQRLSSDAPLLAGTSVSPIVLVSAGFARRTAARVVDFLLTGFLAGAFAALILRVLGGDESLLDRGLPVAGFEMWIASRLMMLSYHGVAES